MNASESDKEQEIREVLSRAEQQRERSGPIRKEAYQSLLELAHSPATSLKKLVTEKIKDFFTDFPDLQDDAINTIYDLCEDQDSQVRIAGYAAITSVSRADKNWLVRNADVLVQLLQSEEEAEVEVVKKALLEHIDMDPPKALQVLCDQCIFDSGILDEQERNMRGRLRTLVIQFLVRDTQRRVQVPNEKADRVLFTGLINAIPKSTDDEVVIIVKDILLPLPFLKTRGPNANALVKTLLDSAQQALKENLRSGGDLSSIPSILVYLQMAHLLVVEEGVADALPLLRFYLASRLISKMTFQKLTKETRILIVCQVADAWSACDDLLQKNPSSNHDHIILARNQLVEACPILFEAITKSGFSDVGTCKACCILLKACENRKMKLNWVVPTHLATALNEVQTIASAQINGPNADVVQSALSLCRSLLEASPKPTLLHQPTGTDKTNSNIASSSSAPPTQLTGKRRTDDRPVSLPQRPISASGQRGEASARSVGSRVQPQAAQNETLYSNAAEEDNYDDPSPISRKRTKRDAREGGAPSLLSRMNSGSNGSAARGVNGSAHRSHQDPPHWLSPTFGTHQPPDPEYRESIQIKGAAARNAEKPFPTSLLDRMNQDPGVARTQREAWRNDGHRGRFNDR